MNQASEIYKQSTEEGPNQSHNGNSESSMAKPFSRIRDFTISNETVGFLADITIGAMIIEGTRRALFDEDQRNSIVGSLIAITGFAAGITLRPKYRQAQGSQE